MENKNNICINVYCYENGLTYPIHVSDKKNENCMDLLLITDKSKSHYVYLKDFNRTGSCAIRQKIKLKNTLADIVYNVLAVKKSCKDIKN